MIMNHKLTRLYPNIFLVTFDNNYDLAMTFLRYQESYESPNPNFKGKPFTILDYMEWYSKEHGNKFTYPDDWSGFNLPHWILRDIGLIPDYNKYDMLMNRLFREIQNHFLSHHKWYLLGCVKGDEETLDHELAHAFYYVDPDYKKTMDNLLSWKYPNSVAVVNDWLIKEGYDKTVLNDEAQAYLSTGLSTKNQRLMKQKRVAFKSVEKRFSEVFKEWKKRKNGNS